MQRFQVPQFITVEDKIIGGVLTAKQFAYVAAGTVLIVISFFTFTGFLALVISFLIGAAAASLAWGKIDGRPVSTFALNAIFFFVRPRVFVWKRAPAPPPGTDAKTAAPSDTGVIIKKSPKLSHSRLSELSWTLDTKLRDDILRTNP